MGIRSKRFSPDAIMRIGLFAIVGGAISLRLTRWLSVPPDLADGLSGLFYGIAIACILWSLSARRAR